MPVMVRFGLLLLLIAAGLWLAGGGWLLFVVLPAMGLSRWDGYRAGHRAGRSLGFNRAGALILACEDRGDS